MSGTTRVYVSQDRLTARVDCVVEPGREDATVADVLTQSGALGISPKLSGETVKSAMLAALSHGSRITGLVLAKGLPPVPPVEGTISWQRDFFSFPLVEDSKTGRVDYRQHLDNSIVARDNPLATITPPKPGKPGIDVFGQPIPVAKPPTPRIRAGSGVRFDEAAQVFVATLDGRVRFAKGVLSVDQTYAIPGSIGLKTGHVSHPGSVDVAKDVEPDSRLEAGGTVHVSGAVEESFVTAGGDILVGQGIIGGGRAKLQAGGSIEAVFAEHADLKAEHDIRLRRALIHCTTDAHGRLLIPDGQIIGGTATAIGGIDVGQVGSHGGVPTKLMVGVDPKLQEQIAARRTKGDEIHEQATQLREKIAPFKTRQSSLTPILREKLTVLLSDLQKIEDQRTQIERDVEQLVEESRRLTESEITIRRKAYPETQLCIGFGKLIVTTEVDGPVVAKLNQDGDVVLVR